MAHSSACPSWLNATVRALVKRVHALELERKLKSFHFDAKASTFVPGPPGVHLHPTCSNALFAAFVDDALNWYAEVPSYEDASVSIREPQPPTTTSLRSSTPTSPSAFYVLSSTPSSTVPTNARVADLPHDLGTSIDEAIQRVETVLRDFAISVPEVLQGDVPEFEYWTFNDFNDVSFGCVGVSSTSYVAFYEELIAKIYLLHNPKKFSEIKRLMTTYKRREQELFEAIRDKYEPLGPPSLTALKKVSFVIDDDDYDYEGLGESMFIQRHGQEAYDAWAHG